MRPFAVVIITLTSLAVLLSVGYMILSIQAANSLREKAESEARIRAKYGDDVIID